MTQISDDLFMIVKLTRGHAAQRLQRRPLVAAGRGQQPGGVIERPTAEPLGQLRFTEATETLQRFWSEDRRAERCGKEAGSSFQASKLQRRACMDGRQSEAGGHVYHNVWLCLITQR